MSTMPTMPTAAPAAPASATPPAAKPAARTIKNAMPPPPSAGTAKAKVAFGSLAKPAGHRVVVYGTGGIGKTTLCAALPGPVAFIDLDGSLAVLSARLTEQGLSQNIVPVEGVTDWQSLMSALDADGWDAVKTIVVDTATKAEALALAHTLKTKPTDKGQYVNSIEGYGFGKGYVLVAETFNGLLTRLDRHARAGRNVVLVCHECTATVPNPEGEDWLRYEPRLQNPPSGKASIRLTVKEWCDHLLFIGYDVDVKNGVAKGGGTKTIYASERPHCMAKSRTTDGSYPLDGNFNWGEIIK
ncbi:MAG: ATP-binding protein [Kiritimatiellae bacterium]|nr:ATP-binding protein [Kiritimatiellia bacterium]